MPSKKTTDSSRGNIALRLPTAEDGPALHQLVGRCPPLDPNSLYCNLLQCSHFADTGLAAQLDDTLVGFVSGYRVPQRRETFFLWQVVVAPEVRGRGLARRMIHALLRRLSSSAVTYLETSITPDNAASWALFRGLARDLNCPCEESILFSSATHFRNAHATEHLLRIGPFSKLDTELNP